MGGGIRPRDFYNGGFRMGRFNDLKELMTAK